MITDPAWKGKPNWYLTVTEDKMIPIDAQRFMAKRAGATVEAVGGSHDLRFESEGGRLDY